MTCASFFAIFIPGLLIGSTSSFLLLRLWSAPPAFHGAIRSERGVTVVMSEPDDPSTQQQVVPAVVVSEDSPDIQQRRRHVLEEYSKNDCNSSSGALESRPIPGGPYRLLVLVHSSPRALEMRSVIRETWVRREQGGSSNRKFVARFVVGTLGLRPGDFALLACENSQHGDLLLLPQVDDHDKSSDSSEKLLQSFVWAVENVQFDYIFKCTDSTFALLDGILSELDKRTQERDLLWGFFAGGVQASKEGRLGEEDWYLCTLYLPYPEGGGYVISRGLVSILQLIGGELEHYAHDDIALGVWLSPFNGIERRHDVRFNTGAYSRGCSNSYLVTHREDVESMQRKYDFVQKVGRLCVKEFSSRPSYHYNWTVPANRCCARQTGVP